MPRRRLRSLQEAYEEVVAANPPQVSSGSSSPPSSAAVAPTDDEIVEKAIYLSQWSDEEWAVWGNPGVTLG